MSIPLTSQVPQLTGGKDNDQLTILFIIDDDDDDDNNEDDDVVKMQMR